MKTFSELKTLATSISAGYESSDPSDATIKNTLLFFAETKYTCESHEGLIYEANLERYTLRGLRDLCIAGLNYAGNKKLIKARFYSAWQQINAIVD